jgi:hypothetical protein
MSTPGADRSEALVASRRMPRRPDARSLAVAGLHLAVLWAFAVAQPWFDVVGQSPTFFAVRGSEPADIVLFAIGLVVLPPLVLVALEALVGLVDARLQRGLHLVFVAVLAAAFLLPVLEKLTGSSRAAPLIPAAALLGAGAAVSYARFAGVRSAATVLAVAPVLFVVLFLFFSPVTKLVTGGDAEVDLPKVSSSTPVTVLVLDELPLTSLLRADGGVDARRYPNVAAFARRADWYRDATTVDTTTEHAVPAILDGRWPRPKQVPTLADHPRSLFALLGRSHDLNVSESITSMCPPALCGERRSTALGERLRSLVSDSWVVAGHLLLPDDLRDGLPSISGRWEGFGDEVDPVGGGDEGAGEGPPARAGQFGRFETPERQDRPSAVRQFLSGIRPTAPGDRPPLHFMHVLLPHQPWQYLPSGRQYGEVTSTLGRTLDRWSDDPLGPVLHFQRHLLQVAHADRVFGQVMDRLRRAGLYDRSLVVVLADHGITFRPGAKQRTVTRESAPDIVPVPLLVKAPHQRAGRVVRSQVRTIDIFPTIADHLGIRLPWAVDGRSARRVRGDRPIVVREAGSRPQAFEADWLRARRAQALRRQVGLFGEGLDRPGIFGVGPRPELVGRSLADLAVRRSRLRASIDQAPALAQVDKRSGFVPAHVTGSVDGDGAGARRDLVLAVNGRVAAVGRPLRGTTEFAMMVPESSLRDGANRVQLLAVAAGPGLALELLAETGGDAEDYVLAGGAIRGPDGRRIAIRDAIRGEVRDSLRVGPSVRLTGWAVDTGRRRPVDRVLAFAGERLVGVARPREVDPQAATLFEIPPFGLGWRTEVPAERLRGGDLRLLGVAGRTAGPLSFSCRGERPPAPGCPRLTIEDGSIRARPGRSLPIARGGIEGVVDIARVEGSGFHVQGWAVRSADRRPVERVIAFAGDRLLFSAAPQMPRPDVASRFATDPDRLGFSHMLPRRLAAGGLRVFAIADGKAVGLTLACGGEGPRNLGC